MKISGFFGRALPIVIFLLSMAACSDGANIAYDGDNTRPEADADLDATSDSDLEPATETDAEIEEEKEIICELDAYRCRTWSEIQICKGDRWQFVKECAELDMVCLEGVCIQEIPELETDGDEEEEWDEPDTLEEIEETPEAEEETPICPGGPCCDNGAFVPVGETCDDNDNCTRDDHCDGKGNCLGIAYTCEVSECVLAAGACDGQGGCYGGSSQDNGTGCYDDPCLINGVCEDGECRGDLNGWCFYDRQSHLQWQEPPQMQDLTDWQSAIDYCDRLVFLGRSDWRLPTIEELRSLIRGCPETETGGACGVTDECTSFEDCYTTEACQACPDLGQCYIHPNLDEDICNNVNFFWSASTLEDNEDRVWTPFFGSGIVYWRVKESQYGAVRCVRDRD